ncbi:microcin ABC transporter ATP-binding protein, partial [Escherichia coli]|nr:microcin ABC transporter ATP-binding protein [Escherichia coli]
DLVGLSATDWYGLRGRCFGMVFQEPMTALNPIMRVGRQVDEVLERHTNLNAAARRQRVLELFGQVLLPDPQAMYD